MLEIARARAPARRPLGSGSRARSRRSSIAPWPGAPRIASHSVLGLAQAFRDASGIGKTTLELPHLDSELRCASSRAPRSRSPTRSRRTTRPEGAPGREALRALARIVGWYVALLALACRTRIGSGETDDGAATRAMIGDLRRQGLTPTGWLALARQLTRPFAAVPDTYPILELVLLLHRGAATDPFAPILGGSLAESLPDSLEEAAARAIARELPQVTALLRASAFLLDYLLVVARGRRGEAWMGTSGTRQSVLLARELPEGWVVLADEGGAPLLVLWPLLQVAVAVPGHGEQLFLLWGRGARARGCSRRRRVRAPRPRGLGWFRYELLERTERGEGATAGNPTRAVVRRRRRGLVRSAASAGSRRW